jgi:molecular chaperone GrpE
MMKENKEKKEVIIEEKGEDLGTEKKENSDLRSDELYQKTEKDNDVAEYEVKSSELENVSGEIQHGEGGESLDFQTQIENLRAEIERLKAEVEDYKTRWIYTFSEYENYRRRVKVEIENAVKDALTKVFINIISALDSLDFALSYIKDEESRKGVELVRQIIMKSLSDSGLKEIEVEVGQNFSPSICEIVDFEFSDEHEEGTILKVLRKGYEFQGRIVRPVQVVVSKKKEVLNLESQERKYRENEKNDDMETQKTQNS